MNTKSGQIMTNSANGVFQEMDKDVKKKKNSWEWGFGRSPTLF